MKGKDLPVTKTMSINKKVCRKRNSRNPQKQKQSDVEFNGCPNVPVYIFLRV